MRNKVRLSWSAYLKVLHLTRVQAYPFTASPRVTVAGVNTVELMSKERAKCVCVYVYVRACVCAGQVRTTADDTNRKFRTNPRILTSEEIICNSVGILEHGQTNLIRFRV